MEYPMSGNLKLCSTCEYWAGARQINYYGTHVMLEDQSVKGKCCCFNSPYARGERYSNNSACFNYERWKVLK